MNEWVTSWWYSCIWMDIVISGWMCVTWGWGSDWRFGETHRQADDEGDDSDQDEQSKGDDDVFLPGGGRRRWSASRTFHVCKQGYGGREKLTLRDFFWYLTAFLVSSLALQIYSAALETFFSMLFTISPWKQKEIQKKVEMTVNVTELTGQTVILHSIFYDDLKVHWQDLNEWTIFLLSIV